MTLVDSAVGREEVDVVLALGVPDIDALGAGEDDGEGVLVVGGVLILGSNGALGGRGVVSRRRLVAAIGAGGLVGVGSHGSVIVEQQRL